MSKRFLLALGDHGTILASWGYEGFKALTLNERYDEQFEIRAGGGRIGDYRQEDGE